MAYYNIVTNLQGMQEHTLYDNTNFIHVLITII